ncbi:MAG: glycosyltransferase [Bacteroidetes bacterium]|nr:glycosyltransferase [Bacteroidota bacterium]
MKVLFISSWYPNPDDESNGIFIKRHAQALSLKNHVTIVFVKSVNGISEVICTKYEAKNIEEHLRFYPKIRSVFPFYASIRKFFKFRNEYKKALNQLTATHFDLIHVNTIFPAAIPALFALKKYPTARLFITEHWSGYYPEDGNYKGLLLTYYTRKLVAKANAVFVISQKLKEAMLGYGLKNNYQLINNAVDLRLFKPQEPKQRNKDVLEILHVSSLIEREKNLSGIIAVAEHLKEKSFPFHLTIVGGSKIEIAACEELIHKVNLQLYVTISGPKPPQEVSCYMNRADVFLLFSNFEGMPVVVIEALACGLPVISSNVGEVKNIIKPKMGIVLQTNSIKECAEALLNYNREHYLNSQQLNQYISENYSPEVVCDRISQLYNRFL